MIQQVERALAQAPNDIARGTPPPQRTLHNTYTFVNAVQKVKVLAVTRANAFALDTVQTSSVSTERLLTLGLARLADRRHHIHGFFVRLCMQEVIDYISNPPSIHSVHNAHTIFNSVQESAKRRNGSLFLSAVGLLYWYMVPSLSLD